MLLNKFSRFTFKTTFSKLVPATNYITHHQIGLNFRFTFNACCGFCNANALFLAGFNSVVKLINARLQPFFFVHQRITN